jgi:hemoglobin
MLKDIENKQDIELLIHTFYGELLKIGRMKEIFKNINFEEHLPNIVHFWSFVLLDEEGYKTNVYDKHVHLPILKADFDTWLEVFTTSVDKLFAGEKADMAKQRASVLSYTFKSKWVEKPL